MSSRTSESFYYPFSTLGSRPEIGQSSNSEHSELSLRSSCHCEKISSIFTSFDPQKANIVQSIGFGGLLTMPLLQNLNNHLSLWLYQRFDPEKMCLNLDGVVELHIKEVDVNLIFGIPFHGRSINICPNQLEDTVDAFKKKLFSQACPSNISIHFLEHILSKEYANPLTEPETETFKIATVLFAMHYLLAPQPQQEFPLDLVSNFVPSVQPETMNWSQFVLWTVGRAATHATTEYNKGSREISIFGCTMLLQVFYLDNLNFGPCTPYHILLPRASAYSADVMSDMIVLDCTGTSNDKLLLFGNKEVRPALDVCYTRGREDHIKMHSIMEHRSLDDYLRSILMVSEAIQLLDSFSGLLNSINENTKNAPEKSLNATNTYYVKLRSRINDTLQNLSTKAAVLLKSRIISMFCQHNAQDLASNSHKRIWNGTTDQPFQKATKYSGYGQHEAIPSNNVQPPDRQTAVSNTIQYYTQRKIVTGHSNFHKSVFDLGIEHPPVTWTKKNSCYMWMINPSLPQDELNRDWIVFSAPKALSISGNIVRSCLKINGSFSVDVVDAIMVLWNYLDGNLYEHFQNNEDTQKRWRHFLPASFAEIVKCNGDYLNSHAIRDSFIGHHLKYDVENCQKIIIPVVGHEDTWSCYLWDFKFKSITILDPTLMKQPAVKAKLLHHHTVVKLHDALFACIRHFFSGWDIKPDAWRHVYLTDVAHKCKSKNSGLYAVHYARSFYAEKLIFKLRDPHESNLCEARGEILYEFFGCSDNNGYKPKEIMEKISFDKF